MASPFQQRALQRKLIYLGLILVLFTAAWVWRHYVVDAQASELAIREQSRGEVDLLGSVVRLGTIGSRGVATCALWYHAQEKQKKNQWNELELLVRTLTKLQPHFITPWIFQSWNLAYNVSVESDRVHDKYFYITRGIGLLAEGERQNLDNPDIRWSIGFFTQHKIGQSDETNTLRSLSQLSEIPPNERDPGRFWVMRDGRQELNLKAFEDFCKEHPQLVRRLREGIRRETKLDMRRMFRCERAEEVVQFLADNFRVPSLWEDAQPSLPGSWQEKQDKLRPLADRFPVLPPNQQPKPPQQRFDSTMLTADSQLRDEDDAYQVARAWYCYAQEPLPPPDDLPGHNKPIVDRTRQRLPRHITTLIFRDYPAQAQRFTSERLQEEGWFDESGWEIPDWFRDQGDKFANGAPAKVGTGRKWGLESWQKTYELWRNLGEANHLLFSSPAEQDNMERQAKAFSVKFQLPETAAIPALREENLDEETRKQFFAWRFMRDYAYYRQVSNFAHHYNRAFVEAKEETVNARRLFFKAQTQRLKNSTTSALNTYKDPGAIPAWRDKVLLKNKEFRRDSFIQEQTYEVQLKYTDLYMELSGNTFKAEAARLILLPMQNPPGGGVCPVGFTNWVPPLIRQDWSNPLLGGPFDVSDSEGYPLIEDSTRMQVLMRLYPSSYQGTPPPVMPKGRPTSSSR